MNNLKINTIQNKTKRDLSIDSFRGLMLVIIAINHLKGFYYYYTWQPIGYVSGAEGFIFLSGLVFGLVYGKRTLQFPQKKIFNLAFKRAGVIYIYHVFSYLAILVLFFTNPYIQMHIEQMRTGIFYDNPLRASLLFLVLLFQPEQLDILPIYIIFVFFAPFMLYLLKNKRTWLVIFISGSFYILTQFAFFRDLIDFRNNNLEVGYFNVFAWQFLFSIGVFIGYSRAMGKKLFSFKYAYVIISLFILGIFFFARHPFGMENEFFDFLKKWVNRPTLGPARLINFLLLAYIIDFFNHKGLKFEFKAFSFLGQHSLHVFSFGIILLYYISPYQEAITNHSMWLSLLFETAIAFSLFIPALLHDYFRKKYSWVVKYGL